MWTYLILAYGVNGFYLGQHLFGYRHRLGRGDVWMFALSPLTFPVVACVALFDRS